MGCDKLLHLLCVKYAENNLPHRLIVLGAAQQKQQQVLTVAFGCRGLAPPVSEWGWCRLAQSIHLVLRKQQSMKCVGSIKQPLKKRHCC
jgi:hypothetical protein